MPAYGFDLHAGKAEGRISWTEKKQHETADFLQTPPPPPPNPIEISYSIVIAQSKTRQKKCRHLNKVCSKSCFLRSSAISKINFLLNFRRIFTFNTDDLCCGVVVLHIESCGDSEAWPHAHRSKCAGIQPARRDHTLQRAPSHVPQTDTTYCSIDDSPKNQWV